MTVDRLCLTPSGCTKGHGENNGVEIMVEQDERDGAVIVHVVVDRDMENRYMQMAIPRQALR